MNRNIIFHQISDATDAAYKKHGSDPWTPHEALGILREEFEEAWECVRDNLTWGELEAELIDVALCVVRYLETEPRFHSASASKITHQRPS